ncbi:MAG: NAD-dependent malic enzyme [Desulfobacterales bacterium]|nr:NAD-dependent malic enzyme [Desulfobacterales bacterium]MDJ0888708.1 NAD-dependent malic enzyme [Desulfobacterales bacterium]
MTTRKIPTGASLLQNNYYNKGAAFSLEERKKFKIDALLPPCVNTIEEQAARAISILREKTSDMEKHIFMMALLDLNLTLYNRVLLDNLEELMPIVYTPTVGDACLQYSHRYRKPQGIFLTADQKGRYAELLGQWHTQDVRVIVVTDGERILGLGDLGIQGMGIPVGKLSLYAACAGIPLPNCLPITIDVGTNNADFLNDPLYIGLKQPRIRGEAYDVLLEEFVSAVETNFPEVLLQFEDFANINAFRLLDTYRDRLCCFNDDIQGTACVVVAGLEAAMRMKGEALADQTILFLGAGSAGTGIGELIVSAMVSEGLPREEAYKRCWFVDSKGLIVASRENLADHKLPFANAHEYQPDFLAALHSLKPAAIVGVSGQPGTFDKQVLTAMADYNARPIVFALSNPTSKAECTAQEAYTWTEGRAIFASGSPFDPVTVGDKTFVPGQGNNAYVFPGIGLGVISVKASRVTDEMFLVAAKALAEQTSAEDFAVGRLYPSWKEIRKISLNVALAVAELAYREGLARVERPDDLEAFIQAQMFTPEYEEYA